MNKKREQVSVLFMLFGILFCVCLITANVLETKQMAFGPVTITGGLLVFPVSTTAFARCGDSAGRGC